MEAGNQMGQAQRPISLDRTLSHAKLIRHLKAPVQLALNSATECLSDGEDHCVPRLTMEVKYRIEGNDPVGSVPYPPESRYAHGGTYNTSDNFPAQKIRFLQRLVNTPCMYRRRHIIVGIHIP